MLPVLLYLHPGLLTRLLTIQDDVCIFLVALSPFRPHHDAGPWVDSANCRRLEHGGAMSLTTSGERQGVSVVRNLSRFESVPFSLFVNTFHGTFLPFVNCLVAIGE